MGFSVVVKTRLNFIKSLYKIFQFGIFFFLASKELKRMKNAFCFSLKSLLVLKIFRFLSLLFGHAEKRLHWKDRLISKFMTSQSGKQRIAIHILFNISCSKGNQTIKFDQLIECNMRNTFLEKSKIKYGGEAIRDHFLKNQNCRYLWISGLNFHKACFYRMPN